MTTPETPEKTRKRLIFRSWHRGTKEMDLLLGSFAEAHVPSFSEKELRVYDDLLRASDPDLYEWITGQTQAPANMESAVLERLKQHRYSKKS